MKADVTERNPMGGLQKGVFLRDLKKPGYGDGILQLQGSEKQTGQTIGQPGIATPFSEGENRTSENHYLSSSIVPIQPKGTNVPLFCIHAGQGNVVFYANLSLHLGNDQPLYGVQAKGIDGLELPSTQMEQMAGYYISEIRKVQPQGPYYLAGYCLGAQIAFEMARQLTRDGQKIALLANFNGISPTYLNSQRAAKVVTPQKNILAKVSFQLNYIAKLPLKEKGLYVSKKIIKKVIRSAKKAGYSIIKLLIDIKYRLSGLVFNTCILIKQKVPAKVAIAFVDHSLFMLQLKYKPTAYSGSMLIFRSPGIYKDPYLGWGDLVDDEIKTFEVSGVHKTRRDIMNEPHARFLAKELKGFLN